MLIGLVPACGSRVTRNNADAAAAADLCDDLANKLAECGFSLDGVACRQSATEAASDARDRARACLKQSCDSIVACVTGELGSVIPPGGGSGGTGSGGAPSIACPGSVRCLDAATAAYCEGHTATTVVCADALAEQGIVSNGCRSDAQGDGCTVDAFLDAGCESGAPVFARCEGLMEENLVDTYVACYQNLNGASEMIPCYQDFVDASGVTVDCSAAQVSCAIPGPQ